MDQYSAFYQNHMGPLAYLRLMMPFGGLQVLARSGQGLLGQSKELDKPMSKILQDNLSKEQWPRSRFTFSQGEIISVRQHTTMLVYYTNLTFLTSKWTSKKSLLSGELRHNWLDMEEGQIPRSLTTQEELPVNTKEEHITKVKHLCSFIGLFNTLDMATPATSRMATLLEEAVASKLLSDLIVWDHSLFMRFRQAKNQIN